MKRIFMSLAALSVFITASCFAVGHSSTSGNQQQLQSLNPATHQLSPSETRTQQMGTVHAEPTNRVLDHGQTHSRPQPVNIEASPGKIGSETPH